MMGFLKEMISRFLKSLQQYFIGLTRAGSHQTWMTFFVVGTGIFLFYLIYLATLIAPDLELVQEQFQKLSTTYERGDLRDFLRRKDVLRNEVARTLKVNRSQHAQMIATNISVYLFPELLPDRDFEKHEALSAWLPLQKKIESNPGTQESRIAFEEMKATFWNYESPDRSSPRLSETARQVLEIYDRLSSKKQE